MDEPFKVIRSTIYEQNDRSFSVLFVDDEEKSRKYFKRSITSQYSVYLAADVDQALDLLNLHHHKIGVLVTDQRMPGKKGTDLLKIMQQQYSDIVCLFTSAYTELSDTIQAINSAQLYRYLEKPWDLTVLREAVTSAMTIFRQRYRVNSLLDERQKFLHHATGSLALELRTPLYKIAASTLMLEGEIKRLYGLYAETVEIGGGALSLLAQQQQSSLELLENMYIEAVKGQQYIDSVLMYTKDTKFDVGWDEQHSIRQCLDAVIADYPFEGESKTYLEINGSDFKFFGDFLSMMQIMSHLIKNAFESLALAKLSQFEHHSTLDITMETNSKYHILSFRDSGVGFSDAVKGFIFSEFYSSKHTSGMGIGLSYCREILAHFNGSIECHSKEGEYAEFVVYLPKIDHNKVAHKEK